ncbi:hypothetical protein PIB30_093717 [Stylosanthes scabra]|uniref:Uncharacterized protein n=1 Tax=Stylosanthes scabra TaxID=79078 RepID=A0ABU6YTE9_9FABA|nr:hypothetical protein [Stylosanthes scabra]
MGSGIIYYEIESREKYEDSDEIVDSDLAVVKRQRYHFDDEPFIHPLHSIQFDPDRPLRSPSLPTKTFPLLKVNRVKKGQDSSRVGNSFRLLKVGCVREMMSREAPEEEMLAIPRPMDVAADEDNLQYLEELMNNPEYSPFHSSQVFAQHSSDDAKSPSSDAHSQPSYDLSGVWPPPVGPSQ